MCCRVSPALCRLSDLDKGSQRGAGALLEAVKAIAGKCRLTFLRCNSWRRNKGATRRSGKVSGRARKSCDATGCFVDNGNGWPGTQPLAGCSLALAGGQCAVDGAACRGALRGATESLGRAASGCSGLPTAQLRDPERDLGGAQSPPLLVENSGSWRLFLPSEQCCTCSTLSECHHLSDAALEDRTEQAAASHITCMSRHVVLFALLRDTGAQAK